MEEIHLPGLELTERTLTVEELYQADGVFITSTTRGLLPVREIAGRAIQSRGDAGERLSRAFDVYLRGDIARRKNTAVVV